MTAIQTNAAMTVGRGPTEGPSLATQLVADNRLGGVVDLGAVARGVVELAQRDLTGAMAVLQELTDSLPVLDLQRLTTEALCVVTSIGGLIGDGVDPVARLVGGWTDGLRDGLGGTVDGTRSAASLAPELARRLEGIALGSGLCAISNPDAGAVPPARLEPASGRAAESGTPTTPMPSMRHSLADNRPTGIVASTEMARSAIIGHHSGTWMPDARARPITAEVTLREVFTDVERSGAETRAQAATADRGVDGDHGGHITGHRFVKDQGLDNLFPQNGDLDLSAYPSLENEMADWVEAGAEVRVTVDLLGGGDRPVRVRVAYEVLSAASGALIYDNTVLFRNAADQTFDRTPSSDMTTMLGG